MDVPHVHAQVDSQRRVVLQAILVLTALAGVLFFVLNLLRGSVGLGLAELAMSVGAASLLPVVRRTPRLRLWTLVFIVPFFGTLLLALATPTASATMFIWALLPPILAHLLLGRRLGLGVSVLVMGIAALIYWRRFAAEPALMEVAAVANVVIYGLTVLALSHVYEFSRERSELALRRFAATDPLTSLANRGEFERLFKREQSLAQRGGAPLSLLLVDLDHFKDINDAFGHGGGDAALVAVAGVIKESLRGSDWACRLGGEEFAVLLPGTAGAGARKIAERLRAAIAGAEIAYGEETIQVTASIGLAELGPDGEDLERVYQTADARLYESKKAGRNRVTGGVGGSAQAC